MRDGCIDAITRVGGRGGFMVGDDTFVLGRGRRGVDNDAICVGTAYVHADAKAFRAGRGRHDECRRILSDLLNSLAGEIVVEG